MLAVFAVSRVDAAPDLTADEILAKSSEAMGPPVQYRIVIGEINSVVSVKDLGGDIGIATRADILGPRVQKATLTTAKFAYEWWPKTGLAIDKTAMDAAMREQVAGVQTPSSAGATNRLLDSATIDGVKHYVIETVIPDALLQSLVDKLSISQIPSGTTRTWINSETFALRKKATAAGEIEYLDITRNIDLPMDRFLPPEGMTFRNVATLEEYVKETMLPPPPKIVERQLADPIWDPVKKRWKGSAPPGWTQDQWDKKVESMPSQPSQIGRTATDAAAKNEQVSRRTLLYANAAIVVSLAAYSIYRKWSRWRAASAARYRPKLQ
jgi:hypothetical protein